jgi:hypothetical protein
MQPYLSIVVSSLDEHHSDDPLSRVQNFVTATLEQCRRHKIPSELIIVEWKRAEDQTPFSEALRLPKEPGPCAVRVIEVPAETDMRHPNALEYAVAKNVGIRRAQGRFILTANLNLVLPEDLMQFVGGQSARFHSLEWDDIAVRDGSLGLGKGWFWKELDGSATTRRSAFSRISIGRACWRSISNLDPASTWVRRHWTFWTMRMRRSCPSVSRIGAW